MTVMMPLKDQTAERLYKNNISNDAGTLFARFKTITGMVECILISIAQYRR